MGKTGWQWLQEGFYKLTVLRLLKKRLPGHAVKDQFLSHLPTKIHIPFEAEKS